MGMEFERRRVLLLAGTLEGSLLRQSLEQPLCEHGWELFLGDSFDGAQLTLRHFRCDALLIDESFYRGEGPEGAAWLAAQRAAPVVLLADWDGSLIRAAMERAVHHWVPRSQVLYQPHALVPFLERAADLGELRQRFQHLGKSYADRQRQVRELLEQLAALLPQGHRSWWCPTPLLTSRLEEELERARRHRVPLVVALGEVRLRVHAPHLTPVGPPLARWVAQQVDHTKRLMDVGGEYGPDRFLLVLPHTLRSGAVACCQRIKAQLEDPSGVPGEFRPAVRACFGIVASPKGARAAEQLLRKAEKCLARARSGKSADIVAE